MVEKRNALVWGKILTGEQLMLRMLLAISVNKLCWLLPSICFNLLKRVAITLVTTLQSLLYKYKEKSVILQAELGINDPLDYLQV